MKASEIRNLDADELTVKEQELVREIFNLRMQGGTGQAENPMRMRHVRRDLARVRTIRRERAIVAEKKAGCSEPSGEAKA